MSSASVVAYEVVQDLVWIASYPKSGNTWVRFMVCNLLFGRQESASRVNALIPDVHEPGAMLGAALPTLLKTHFPYSTRMPEAHRTRAAIYVVRHPADVLASNFFYARRSALRSDDSADAFNRYVDEFLEHRGDPHWQARGMGNWIESVSSWRNPPFPVVRLRYEDLTDDPINACRAIAGLLRPQSTDADIASAVQESSFQRMREVERADIKERRVGIFFKPYLQASIDSGSRFMRRGVVGDGNARLNADQRARLRDCFGPLMTELGYGGP